MWRISIERFLKTAQPIGGCDVPSGGGAIAKAPTSFTNPPWLTGRFATRAVEAARAWGDQAGGASRHA